MSAHASPPPVLPTLATQSSLPRRVRDLLGLVLKIASNALESPVLAAIKELEQQIYVQIGVTEGAAARERLHGALGKVEAARSELLLNFINSLEAELASVQSPQIVRGHLQTRYRSGDELALIDDQEIEETSALTDAATRAELQNSLPLFLLGQRFGVLAGRPAFDAETLPIGPQALCRSIRRATERLGLDVQVRLMLYRAFERQVMRDFGSLVEVVNLDLARNGVLPSLQYVPVRARRTEQAPGVIRASGDLGDHRLSLVGNQSERTGRAEMHTRVAGGGGSHADAARQAADLLVAMAATQGGALASEQGFNVLRQLMSSRRQLLGKLNPVRSREGREPPHVVSANDLQEALRGMQNRPVAPVMSHGRATPRNVSHLKQDMLAMLRRVSPNQEAPALADEHNDAIDLVSMLYDNLVKDVKPGSTASILLSKLQVPLMRVALQDSTFFTKQEHPARQMLNTIAETGATWLSEDENDSALINQMHSIVDRAVHDYRGDPSIFNNVLNELLNHLHILSRKAEVAERRHVEAAQGKEKLSLARDHASACVDALIKNQKLPRFTRTMLSQAWTDVLALTALRQGENSPAWHQQLKVAERLIEIAQRPTREQSDSEGDLNLQRDIEDGLAKVGYQGGDVTAIANRLVHPNSVNSDDASSRTELTMRLKAQARLGEELPGRRARRIPLTSAEQVQFERIQQTPVGTWFEFVTNPQGDRVRRRLAWFSTATGAALFVNHRGQKNAEYTLESLARMLAKGQVRIIEEEKGTIIDHAWEHVLTALRSFALPDKPEAPAK